MSTLGGIWDGEEHRLDPEDYFKSTGATLVIDGWEEDEEEDVLSPFESPTLIPVLRDTATREPDPRFPNARLEQAWGSLSVVLTAMAYIVGVEKKQFQLVDHKNGTMGWSFQTTEFITERM